jgi:hypothetical protein
MPNRATHQTIAIVTGAVTAFACAPNRGLSERLAEAIGGGIGGWTTGMLADKLDPPDHPHHRGNGHALVPNAIVAAAYANIVSDWQQALRAQATAYARIAAQIPPGFEQCWYRILEFLCRALSGAIVGPLVGHWSHLLLDSQTAYGIPLAYAGF